MRPFLPSKSITSFSLIYTANCNPSMSQIKLTLSIGSFSLDYIAKCTHHLHLIFQCHQRVHLRSPYLLIFLPIRQIVLITSIESSRLIYRPMVITYPIKTFQSYLQDYLYSPNILNLSVSPAGQVVLT